MAFKTESEPDCTGQVDEAADFAVLLHDLNDVLVEVLGMAGHETEPKIPLDGRHGIQQLGKRPARPAVGTVGIDVLSQQSNFPIAFRHQPFDLGDDIFGLSGTFAAADVRHDTIGTKVVAPVHDIHPGVGIAGAQRLVSFDDFPFLFTDFYHALFFLLFKLDQLAQLLEIQSSEHDIDKREFLFEYLRLALFLSHTSADGNDQPGLPLLELFQGSDIPECVIFRIFTDTAGVEYDNIRFLRLLRLPIAQLCQNTRDLFRLVDVHLAAVRDDMVLFFHKFPVFKFFFHYTLFRKFYQVFQGFLTRFHHKISKSADNSFDEENMENFVDYSRLLLRASRKRSDILRRRHQGRSARPEKAGIVGR